jgi:glycosyltransferase involved in cell wall biosynthesis
MRVSGFTLVRNGIKYFYPFVEAIKSILPICDELIVNVGESEDKTFEAVEAIGSEKIKVIKSVWDMNLREGGKVLSIETNKALEKCTGDWCFYIQADEVLHEKYIPNIQIALEKYLNDEKVEALRFKYKHFYGSYDYCQDNYRNWYLHEVRIIKNNRNIISWGDAMGFRHKDSSPVKYKDVDAEIYHYGWVKPPDTMLLKRIDFHKLYHTDDEVEQFAASTINYDDLGNLKKFEGTHPAVMKERISLANWNFDAKLNEQKPDWIRKILIFLHPVIKRIHSPSSLFLNS